MSLSILFLSIDFVLPADRGLRVRALSQLRVLSSLASVERITLLCLSDAPVAEERLRALERQLPKVRAEPVVAQPTHMRRSPKHLPRLLRLRLGGTPYLIAKHDSAPMHQRVELALRAHPYAVVYVGHLGMAAYLKGARRLAPRARFVLEEHNVEWEIFERLAPTFRRSLRPAARLEARALRAYERRALRDVDAVIAISDADAEALRRLSGVSAHVVPNHIEPDLPRVEQTQAPRLAYTGLLAWQPNAQGLDWFCTEVWPLVRRQMPDATVTLAGPGLRRAADGSLQVPAPWRADGIHTVGYVEDLEQIYGASLAMIAPILGGSGVRMKLLESMRAGMPTVTTTDGAAGLAVESGREMLISDQPADFANNVVRLLSEPELRQRLRAAGYAYLRAHHSMAAAQQRLSRALGLP